MLWATFWKIGPKAASNFAQLHHKRGCSTVLRMGTLQRARSNQALTFPGSNQSLLDMGNQPLTPRVRKAPGTTVKFRPSPQLSLARTYGCHHHLVLQNRVSFEPIPIEKVDVEVNIVHSLAEVTVKQRYRNDTTAPIECTYVKVVISVSGGLGYKSTSISDPPSSFYALFITFTCSHGADLSSLLEIMPFCPT